MWLKATQQLLARRLRQMAHQVGHSVGGIDPDEHERLRDRVRKNAAWKARHDEVLDEWRHRIREGAHLNLIDDHRVHLIQNNAEQRADTHSYYMLCGEVREWCDRTLGGMVYEIPLHSSLPIGAIWFTDPLDAVAFKIRWY